MKYFLITAVLATLCLTQVAGECIDVDLNCERFEAKGYCTDANYTAYMTEKCAKTCGFDCKTEVFCLDTDINCGTYKDKNYCENQEYLTFMSTNCPVTCGFPCTVQPEAAKTKPLCNFEVTPCGCAAVEGCGWTSSNQMCKEGSVTDCNECDSLPECPAKTPAPTVAVQEVKKCATPASTACDCAKIEGCGWSKSTSECIEGGSTDCGECGAQEGCQLSPEQSGEPICDDIDMNCGQYAEYCQDPTYHSFLSTKCVKTCDFECVTLTPAPTVPNLDSGEPICEDIDINCYNFVQHCTNPDYKNFLEQHCVKSCNFPCYQKPAVPVERPGADGKPICDDINMNCPNYAKSCKDPKYELFLMKECVKTCGFNCYYADLDVADHATAGPVCDDKDTLNCPNYAKHCADPQYSNFLKENCVKTCGFECFVATPVTAAPVSGSATPATPAPIDACADKSDKCSNYKTECTNQEFKKWMIDNCYKTCGFPCNAGLPTVVDVPSVPSAVAPAAPASSSAAAAAPALALAAVMALAALA